MPQFFRHDINLGRRHMIGTGLAATALALGGSASAATGKVWLDYDQKTLDKVYNQSNYAPNIKTVIARYGSNSNLTRERLGKPKRLSYGDAEIEALDLYATTEPNAPIHIFLHGGAWRAGDANGYGFLAEPFVGRGAHFVIPDFTNVLENDGSLIPMSEQIQRSIAWVYKNAESFGGDSSRIYLSGHSSGGHLAGVMVTTDWKKFDLPPDVIKGAVLISGMFDLKPVRLSSRSNYVAFTDEIEHKLSPQRHLDQLNTPLILVYGDLETPEFIRQSKDFAAAVEKAGKQVELIEGAGYNHFEIAETLANPYGIAGLPALKQMGL
ncbi:MAG TPA: alpha/beta hydrolase [Pusillimonas sp.]|uniref:alpha/beta hydrolase n=1 Tax=Pusillimonas sp. TaxID=3040095 RepID=UPI002CB4865E|nr:alpha/beta hydrolase [Pusillimonas sp.]HUH87821.1 alpha/beta hydrolase [Pusillimonas sp.]